MYDTSPTARALLVLEMIQGRAGTTADRLAERLGVSERAARRYVGILREAGIPIESTRGPHGGYRIGRGVRLPPLMFSTPEALGLVMALLESEHGASSTSDPVESALGKIIRVLPESIAKTAEAVRRVSGRGGSPIPPPDPEITAKLVQASSANRRVRVGYRIGDGPDRPMEIDPWAVVVRHGRWYLLGWSHTRDARRVLRVDRIRYVDLLDEAFTPPEDLDAFRTLEEHLSESWKYPVEVTIDAPVADAARWIPRNLGRLEPIDDTHTRLTASTEEPTWYATQLAAIHAPFHIHHPPELREASRSLAQKLLQAAAPTPEAP